MRTNTKISFLFVILIFTSLCLIGARSNAPIVALSHSIRVEESSPMKTTYASSPQYTNADYTATMSFQENFTGIFEGGGCRLLQFSSSASDSSLFSRHLMCRDHDIHYDPIEPTTIFRPSDVKAECLTTVSMEKNDIVEFRWYYRNDSSETWVFCYIWSYTALYDGEHGIAGYLNITGCWPGLNYPRAYKVEVYLAGFFSFSEFFEVTNGGLDSPRVCRSVVNGNPFNITSRFTIGNDARAYHCLKFDKIAYFNEELVCSHSFTTVWVQPNGSAYKTHSGSILDYKDENVTWNYWEHVYAGDDYIDINSSTPVGNWKVEVYLDSYYFNDTSMPYGPVAVIPFIVGSEPVADWTFMVYLDADNPLEIAAIDIFENITSVGSSSNVSVIVQMDRHPEYNSTLGYDDRYGNWSDCYRFYVIEGMTPTPENATLGLGEVNMGAPSTLKDFVNWTINNYPANYYFLVLWDHGAGCMGVCFDVTSGGDNLTLPEIGQALTELPVIVDAVFVDACSMSMIEVAYQLKDCANILVGPEGLGYAPAPYNNYLASLISNSLMPPSKFAQEIVNEYISWCLPIINIPNATISATDLTKITSLKTALDDFSISLKENATFYHEQISLAQNQTESFIGPSAGETGYYLDLYHFAQLTYQYVPEEKIRNAANHVITALSIGNTIIIHAHKEHPNSHGLSIFFPNEKWKYDGFGNSYEKTSFAIDTSWDEFVQRHLSIHELTIQTPYPDILIEVNEEQYATDADGKIRLYVLPENHTINVPNLIPNGSDSREVFVQWNDNNTSNPRTLFIDKELTLEAEYKTQYRLIISTNFGTTNPSAGEHWRDEGESFSINSSPPSVVDAENERYSFGNWTGTGPNSYTGEEKSVNITMYDPINETATWAHEYRLIIVSLHGSPSPLSGWFEAGASISGSVNSPASAGTGVQYVCTGWIGTGSVPSSGASTAITFTISMPSTIDWTWKVQYHLAARTDPAGLSPQPVVSPLGPWYDNSTLVNCTAKEISGYIFDHWTANEISWERGISTIAVTVDGSYEVVAHYVRARAWWEALSSPENLQIILGVLGIVVSVAFVGTAGIRARKRRSIVRAFLAEIEDVYLQFKLDPKKCEEELLKLRSAILKGLTDGKITEENYNILDKTIDKYVQEVRKQRDRRRTNE